MKDWIKITRSNDALSGYILRAEIFMVCQNPEGGSEILLRQLGQNSCITATETPEEIMALLEGEPAPVPPIVGHDWDTEGPFGTECRRCGRDYTNDSDSETCPACESVTHNLPQQPKAGE
jgi:hypothetical protein